MLRRLYKAYVVSAVAGAVSFIALAQTSKSAGVISDKGCRMFTALAISGATVFVGLARSVLAEVEA